MAALPGSCGYSFLGDKSVEFYRDPERFISTEIEETSSKIFQSRLLNKKTVFVCSYEGTRELLQDKWVDFEHGYMDFLYNSYGDNLLFENGKEASYLRDCMMPLLSNTVPYENLIKTAVDGFANMLTSNGTSSVNVYQEFKTLMTNLCLQLFLGFPDVAQTSKSIAELATLHWHGIISMPVNLKIPFAGETGWHKAIEAKEQLLKHVRERIKQEKSDCSMQKSENCDPSVLQSLLQAPFRNAATEVEQHILLFISALIPKAFSSIITSFVLELSGEEKRALRERAVNDSHFHKRALLEVQRLWPPFFGGRRISVRDTIIGGYKVPKGHSVVYVSYFAQRDSSKYADPDLFDPERWLGVENANPSNSTFTYGAGERRCIGHQLIQHILLCMTKSLLEKFNWSVDGEAKYGRYKMLPVARPTELPFVRFTPK